MNLIFKLFTSFFLIHFVYSVTDTLYSRQPFCGVDQRIDSKCSSAVSSIRSSLECLAICSRKGTSCLGASITSSLVCYIHGICQEVDITCIEEPESTEHDYFIKKSENVWNSGASSRKCVDGWVGPRCNQLPKSCHDLITSGYETGAYRIMLDLSDHYQPNTEVLCSIKATEPTYANVILMKNSGGVHHDKEWAKYRSGYGLGSSHFWTGLDKWNVLSHAGFNTLTFVARFDMSRVCEFKWTYYNFQLKGEHENFAFSFDHAVNTTTGCSGTNDKLGDCFGELQNASFSTWDRDDDSDPVSNCAIDYGAGWWYWNCQGPCHILGWGHGYVDLVPFQRLISLIGIDMDHLRQKLMSLEMKL